MAWSAMAQVHHIGPEQGLHGFVSREVKPALTIDPGDTVVFQTLDSCWGAVEQPANFAEPREFSPRDRSRDVAHASTGPVEIRGARPKAGSRSVSTPAWMKPPPWPLWRR